MAEGSLELYCESFPGGGQTITIDPINVDIGDEFTLELFGVQVSFTATAATDANVVNGLKAAIDASPDPEWNDVTATVDGDRLILSYSTATGITRIWRGDAPAVAQVTELTPNGVSVGDVVSVTINGKSLSFTAATDNAADVCDGLLETINESSLPEFSDFSGESSGGTLTLRASTPGVPFEVSSVATGGTGTLTITTTETGAQGTTTTQSFVMPETQASFVLRYNGHETAVDYSDDAATVAAALEALPDLQNVVVVIDTQETYQEYTIDFDAVGTVRTIFVFEFTKDIVVSQGTPGPPESQVVVLPTDFAAFTGSFRLTFDGFETDAIAIHPTISVMTAAAVSALEALPNVEAGNITAGYGTNSFTLTFDSAMGDVPLMTAAWDTEPENYYTETTTEQNGSATLATTHSVTHNADAGTFTLTVDSQTTAPIGFDADQATVEAALEALGSVSSASVTGSAGSWNISFDGSHAGTFVGLTGDGSSLSGSGGESFTVNEVTPSSGPNHWDDPQNWLPNGVPVSGDAVRFEFGNVDCLYGLDQASVLLTSLHFGMAWSGKLGLQRLNDFGFYEYRLRDLTIGATEILVGYGDGNGSGKIQLDTGSNQTAVEVRNSGGGLEAGIPAVTWRGSHSLNTVEVHGGEFGASLYSDQTSRIRTLTQRGGTVSLSNCTLDEVDAPAQQLTLHDCFLGTFSIEL